jgi:hypothetical protein
VTIASYIHIGNSTTHQVGIKVISSADSPRLQWEPGSNILTTTAKRQDSRSKLAVFETMGVGDGGGGGVGDGEDDNRIGENSYLVKSLAICRGWQSVMRYVLEILRRTPGCR